MKGSLSKFIARSMHMTITIRLEDGSETEVELNDDLVMAICGSHYQVSYTYQDSEKKLVGPDAEEIIVQIEDGRIVSEEVR